MKRLLLCQSVLLFTAALQTWAIDFTPRYSDTLVGGVVRRQLFFLDGQEKVTLSLGLGTKVEAGDGGAVFRFSSIPDATLVMKPSPMSADQAFSGPALTRYREAAITLLPEGAADIDRLEETEDPFTINGGHSYRMVFAYGGAGVRRKASVTFANINRTEQIALVTVADQEHFEDASEKSWRIIRTWLSTAPE